MKKKFFPLAVLLCLAASPCFVNAAEAEAKGKARPEAKERVRPAANDGVRAYAVPTRKVTYLGVYTEKLSPVVSRQLGLADNLYLSVEQVSPGSPAEKAGVEKFDVLQKLDDQILVNQAQLGDLVRSRKPGEEVELTVLRNGKGRKITAKLGQMQAAEPTPGFRSFSIPGRGARGGARALPRGGFGPSADHDALRKRIQEELERARKRHGGLQGNSGLEPSKRLRELLEKHGIPGGIGVLPTPDPSGSGLHFDFDLHLDAPEIDDLLEKLGSGSPGSSSWSSTINLNERTIIVSDPAGALELKEKDGHKTLKATGPDGELIFEGPVNTEAEKKALPGDLRARLEKLEKRVKMQVRPGSGKPRSLKPKPEASKPADDRLL